MNRDERCGYQRGYYAAANNRWPKHVAPDLPPGVQADLLAAAVEAEGVIDTFFAITTTDDDYDDDEDIFGFWPVKQQLLRAIAAVRAIALDTEADHNGPGVFIFDTADYADPCGTCDAEKVKAEG